MTLPPRSVLPVLVAPVLAFAQGLPAADFMRGDVDGSGRLAVSDAIRILAHLFQGDAGAVPCADAADTDDSGALDLADAIHLLSGLFLGGPPPATPFPACGADPTQDELECEEACPPLSVYFGKEFRADGLFFVIDFSGTMQENNALGRAKNETERLLEVLPQGLEFALVFASNVTLYFPADRRPAESTEEMKAAGITFLRAVSGGRGSCDIPALLLSLEFARSSRAREPAVFYVTTGGGGCTGWSEDEYLQELRDTVTADNAGLARIHTFQVFPGRGFDGHLEELALRNGGTYTPLPPP